MSKKAIDNSKGPKTFGKRDEHGLLNNVQYHFNEDGSVDWRKMIHDEHLYPNKEYFNGDAPKSIEGIPDNKLLIKLSGIKELARLRGFTNVQFEIVKTDQEHACAICTIDFISNYEVGDDEVRYEEVGNGTLSNTVGFTQKFLETVAANRAYVRCVRNFLNIHICGADEIDKTGKELDVAAIKKGKEPEVVHDASLISPQYFLEVESNKKGYEDFTAFSKGFLNQLWEKGEKELLKNAKEWKDFSDLSGSEARVILSMLKKS